MQPSSGQRYRKQQGSQKLYFFDRPLRTSKIFEQQQEDLLKKTGVKKYKINLFFISNSNLPRPSAIPRAIRDAINIVTDEAIKGVKKVSRDHVRTAKVSTFLPPYRLLNEPPMI